MGLDVRSLLSTMRVSQIDRYRVFLKKLSASPARSTSAGPRRPIQSGENSKLFQASQAPDFVIVAFSRRLSGTSGDYWVHMNWQARSSLPLWTGQEILEIRWLLPSLGWANLHVSSSFAIKDSRIKYTPQKGECNSVWIPWLYEQFSNYSYCT